MKCRNGLKLVMINTDNHTKKQRSYNMSMIKSRNTSPELAVRDMLERAGFEFHPSGISRNPDFACRKTKTAVFIDGCFWHGCPIHFKEPKSNTAYWHSKIEKNILRDRETDRALENQGWRVLRIWEHEIKDRTFEKKVLDFGIQTY